MRAVRDHSEENGMRPEDYDEQNHERCCGKCKHAHRIRNGDFLACLYGESSRIVFTFGYPTESHEVEIDRLGCTTEDLEGDTLSRFWGETEVYANGICGKFERREDDETE